MPVQVAGGVHAITWRVTIHKAQRDLVAEFDSVKERLAETDDRRRALEVARRLVRVAERLVDVAPFEADAHQMLGLAWYYFPHQSSWRSWHCRIALERALTIEPGHPWARKLLGHLLFDQEHYAGALRHFEKLDDGFFEGPEREWELLKLRELRLVCRVRLAPTVLPRDFAAFCASYTDARSREDKDIEHGSTVPLQELSECAEWLLDNDAAITSTPVREILSFLRRYRSEVSFWKTTYQALLLTEAGSAVE